LDESHGVSQALIDEAHEDIRRLIPPTPTQLSLPLSERLGRNVWLKLEIFQPVRSFKIRGAIARFASLRRRGHSGPVVTCSAGNHGQAVAWCGRKWGWPTHVFVPSGANQAKVASIRREGGEIHEGGKDYQAAFELAKAYSEDKGWPFVHGYDDPELIAGQGSVGIEILEECPEVETVIAGVGGGGLLAGIALAMKARRPELALIGIEPEGAPSMRSALLAGHVVTLPEVHTIADGLAPGRVSERTLRIFQGLVDDVRLVSDESLWPAMETLVREEHLITEPSGAAPLAALESDPSLGRGGVVLVVSGGNLSPADLSTLAGRLR